MRNVAFINCAAMDCADGGWDIKAGNVVYVNCVGLRNKMNFRVWQHGFFYNCLERLFVQARRLVDQQRAVAAGRRPCRPLHLPQQREPGLCVEAEAKGEAAGKTEPHVTLQNCLVSHDGVGGPAALYVDESRVTKHDTAEWQPESEKNEARRCGSAIQGRRDEQGLDRHAGGRLRQRPLRAGQGLSFFGRRRLAAANRRRNC